MTHKIFYKVKGAILQYAVVVAVLIFFLVFSFILLTHTQNLFRNNSRALLENIQLINDGFNTIDEVNTVDYTPLTTKDSLNKQADYWGAFLKVKISNPSENQPFSKIALMGSIAPQQREALYLADNNQPLVLVGNTIIKGKASLPASGIKAGSIGGKYFTGSSLVDEPIATSSSTLPQLSGGFEKYISTVQNKQGLQKGLITGLEKKVTNSFMNTEKVIYDQNIVVLTQELIGNIRVQSDKEIVLTASSKLTDVTVVAPIVRIDAGFKGRIHVVAEDSIIVDKNVHLLYPSSLIISKRNTIEDRKPQAIVLSENTIVEGAVLYLSEQRAEKKEANILINESTLIKGDVYCEGFVELKGTVEGTVYTQSFLTKASGGVYINHIFNGTILGNKKEKPFCGLSLNTHKTGIAQWLY